MVNRNALRALLLGAGISACQSTDGPSKVDTGGGSDTACTVVPWYPDADGDGYGDDPYVLYACTAPEGYVALPGDCDDQDARVSPGTEESCDGKDNDCDGAVDESGLPSGRYYWDLDGDGYGAERWDVEGCDLPDGVVQDNTDCDDTNSSISPAAVEVCDGVDNDCDDETDESTAFDAVGWYDDLDGDGWGGASEGRSCAPMSATEVTSSGDCDDTDASIYPGAIEVCDGVDNNCDTYTDEPAVDAASWYRDADGDGAGDPAARRVSCDPLSGFVGTDDDCDDTNPAIYPGADEICGDGLDNNCDGVVDDCPLFTAP